MTSTNIFLGLIYLAYVASPAIRDELVFRGALLATSIGFVAWGFMIDDGVVVVVANVLFMIISLRHVVRLAKQRQPVDLSEEQELIHSQIFDSMSPREFLLFWHLGVPDTLTAGDVITKAEAIDDVIVLMAGDVFIELSTGDLERSAPLLLGEMSYALGVDAPATATVRCDEPIEVRRWTKTKLRDLQRSHPELAVPFLRSIGANLAAKIR